MPVVSYAPRPMLVDSESLVIILKVVCGCCRDGDCALYVSGWFHEASDWQQGWLTHTNRSAKGSGNGGVRRLKVCAREQADRKE